MNFLKTIFKSVVDWYIYNTVSDIDTISAVCEKTLSFMEYHKLDMLYYDYLIANDIEIPKEVEIRLREKKEFIINKNMHYLSLADKITTHFKESDPFIVLKGVALMTYKYKKIYHRSFNDVDFLISEKDIDKLEEYILKSGYVHGIEDLENHSIKVASRAEILFQRMYTHELYGFIKRIEEPNKNFFSRIDVNFKFSWNGVDCFPKINFDHRYVLDNYFVQSAYNKTIRILKDELQFIHLCCHFYNEAMFFALDKCYKEGDPREILLNRLFDILLFKENELDCDKIFKLSKIFNCTAHIAYVLKIIIRILGNRYFSGLNSLYRDEITKIDYDIYASKKNIPMIWEIDIDTRIFDLNKKRMYLNGKCLDE